MMRVRDLMTTDVITLNEDDDLDLARMEMSLARIRHLPVVRKGRLVGLITHRDLLRAMCSVFAELDGSLQNELLKSLSVAEIMRRDVRSIDSDRGADEAAAVLLETKFGCLPVTEDGDLLVGIVTEADFVELAVRFLEKHLPKDDEAGGGDEQSSPSDGGW